MKVVILVGGFGIRLAEETDTIPTHTLSHSERLYK